LKARLNAGNPGEGGELESNVGKGGLCITGARIPCLAAKQRTKCPVLRARKGPTSPHWLQFRWLLVAGGDSLMTVCCGAARLCPSISLPVAPSPSLLHGSICLNLPFQPVRPVHPSVRLRLPVQPVRPAIGPSGRPINGCRTWTKCPILHARQDQVHPIGTSAPAACLAPPQPARVPSSHINPAIRAAAHRTSRIWQE
jgi:hypothetical protein